MVHMGDDFSRQDAPKTTSVKCEQCGKVIKDVPLFILKNDAKKLCTHCFYSDR